MDEHKYILNSFAQEAEDLILYRIFGEKKNGFFIDIGAYHPIKYSNTYFFYKKGWRGINIDAMPNSMELFNKYRPNDINIEAFISSEEKSVNYHIFNEPALNNGCELLSKKRHDAPNQFKLIDKKVIQTKRLDKILNDNIKENQEIDFLSIDIEGEEFEALISNNWNKYLPKVILVEFLESTLESIIDDKISKFLKEKGYIIFAKSFNTVFYMTNDFFKHRMGIK
ncbi:FkbM family methyltransferase [Aliarcobacter cryaerophilus]|uniref:FkbM family methyltransferase n=1 Tax=Aliarcobacter cryaerophilus TaxID=28198 RepID=UPI0021B5F458|nr:FkbM family methyltransferase [Aliarcobacter cryaerophilus]MCT7528303.1 FkbM family methyltransferase [Aliarcobacter cryaerophilus]